MARRSVDAAAAASGVPDPNYQYLLVERTEDGLEWLTLNRPDSMNGMNTAMLIELRRHFEELRYDMDVRVVILKGAGRAFCTGMDMKQGDRGNKRAAAAQAASRQKVRTGLYNGNHWWSDVVRKMRSCPQPIIACVHGYAMGGGFAIALGADIRFAVTGTKFNVQMIRIGTTGGDVGISYHLPRAVGSSVAAELMYTGRFITAERGVRVGLVSDVYEDMAQMVAAAEQMAREMLRTAPEGLRFTKECLRLSVDAPSMEAAMAIEDRQQMLMTNLASEFKSRVSDFAGKQATDPASSSIFHEGKASPGASKL